MKSAISVSVVLTIFGLTTGFELDPCVGIDDVRSMPDPTSCTAFYICVGGIATPGECPPGYYFDAAHEWCDWPDRVDCVSVTTTNIPDSTTIESSTDEQTTTEEETESTTSDQPTTTEEQTESTTNIETTTETVIEVPTSVCNGIDNGVLVRNSNSCQSFFHCIDNLAFPNTCPFGLLFNGVYCDLGERAQCGSETTTKEVPSTTTDDLTTEAETTNDDSTSSVSETGQRTTESTENSTMTPSICSGNNIYAHTSKCGQYIMCLDGTQIDMACYPGKHFSKEKGICVSREDAKCHLEDPVCDRIESNSANYFPHPHYCNRFFVCFGGELFDLACNGGDHWNDINGWCIPASESTCVEQSSSVSFDLL